ncbi:unnamed protein product [Brassicogethes aeneus]|uniref:N-terminal methionine N(alpha)-acetyltransferase NatC n=1 Tax=Brassicogethes aeneus TaxID=1431903 RepID=A0A9P0FM06_BRAAE|nr:unnamed protein product [Brassicogethes aeneus]
MNKNVSKKKCTSENYVQENVIINNGAVNGDLSPEKCPKINQKDVVKKLNEENIETQKNIIKHNRKKKTKLKEPEVVIESIIETKTSPSSSNLEKTINDCSTKDILDVVESLVCMKLDANINEIQDSPVVFIQYESELQMPMIMKIIQKDLSEPYSIYTYRYFIHNWPKLCFLAMCGEKCVGAIVCKLDTHRKVIKRGYIAMLAVDKDYRKKRIGSKLVELAIEEMIRGDADEVVLETEVTNKSALQLYEKLGFVRDKRLFRYYLNGVDALRLKLWLR